jgi:hypothetical protein
MKSYVFQVELAHEDDGVGVRGLMYCPAVPHGATSRKRHCRRPRRASGTLPTGTLRNVIDGLGRIHGVFAGPAGAPPRRRTAPRRRLRCAHGSGQGECGLDRRRRMGKGRSARGDSGRMPRERRPGAVRKRGGLASRTPSPVSGIGVQAPDTPGVVLILCYLAIEGGFDRRDRMTTAATDIESCVAG